ncbi:MAG: T9SS type A sorting domain-containing protein [bacterium]
MKNVFGFLLAVMAFSVQISWSQLGPIRWEESGLRIRQGYHIEWQRSAEMDADGNVIYTWSDTRTGDRDVYAQKISPSGAMLWAETGVAVVQAPGRQEDPLLIPTGLGDYIFIWNDLRDDTAKGDLYAQKISANGDLMWNPSGVPVSLEADFDSPASLRIVADGTGGAILVWQDLRNGDEGDIYASRLLADGSIPSPWLTEGLPVVVAPAGQQQISVDTDGSGGVIVAWSDARVTGLQGRDIYIQRISINGTLEWGAGGVVLCDTLQDQTSPKLCPDGAGGAFVVWEDKRTDYFGDLFFQHVDQDGNVMLPVPDGKALIRYTSKQEQPRLVADGSGYAVIIWLDARQNPYVRDIYAQKVTPNGNLLWDPLGNAVCTQTMTEHPEARLIADGAGSVICTWIDERVTGTYKVYAQKINSNGSMAWASGGVTVCEAPGKQEAPLVRSNSNYSFISWADLRSGSIGISYQKLNSAGEPQMIADGDTLIWGLSGDAKYPTMVQNSHGKIFIFFQDLREGSAGYTAFLQMLDNEGNLYLEEDGRPICPNPPYTTIKAQEWIDACPDDNDGAFVVWKDYRDSSTEGVLIVAQRIDSTGNFVWSDAGVQIASYAEEQAERPFIVEDGSGGAIIAWSGFSPTWDLDVYVAKITAAGVISWITQVSSVAGEDEVATGIAADGSGGVYLAYRGGTSGTGTDFNVHANYISASGALQWGSAGLTLCNENGKQMNSRAVSLGVDGAIFLWEDERSGAGKDLYVQRVNAAGNIQWEASGRAIITELGDQANPDLSLDGMGYLYMVWEDFRGGQMDVYMQKLTLDGISQYPNSGLPVSVTTGEQSYAQLLSDNTGGNYVFWHDYRNVPNVDIFGSHLDADGALTSNDWMVSGNAINNYFQKQNYPTIIGDFANGAVVIWEDKRASGKAEVIDLYAQRVNEYSSGIIPNHPKGKQPESLELSAAYPNPFNPEIQIEYAIHQPGNVRLAVFDTRGRQVAELVNDWQTAGFWKTTWNAQKFPSGPYVVRLELNGQQQVQKVFLLK